MYIEIYQEPFTVCRDQTDRSMYGATQEYLVQVDTNRCDNKLSY